jgi:hypothetical protein
MNATLNPAYTSVTTTIPPTSATGSVRRGSTISSLILPRSHQPPNAKNAPMSAPPSTWKLGVAALIGVETMGSAGLPRANAATTSNATTASFAAAVQRSMRPLDSAPRMDAVDMRMMHATATIGTSDDALPNNASVYCASPTANAAVRPGSITSNDIHP